MVKGGWCTVHEVDCAFSDNFPVLEGCVAERSQKRHLQNSLAFVSMKHHSRTSIYGHICNLENRILIWSNKLPIVLALDLLHLSIDSLQCYSLVPSRCSGGCSAVCLSTCVSLPTWMPTACRIEGVSGKTSNCEKVKHVLSKAAKNILINLCTY